MTAAYFLGIDIGTQGARVVLIDAIGNLIGEEEERFLLSNESREEQSPSDWWKSCLSSLQKLIYKAKHLVDLDYVKAVSVTSTSGTVIPIDVHDKLLYNAIMYSDKRSAAEGILCREMALEYHPGGYTGFNSSSGLSKMVWFVNNFPDKAARINKWIHATDYIIGMLSSKWAITDYTNVLKSGYDLERNEWPEYLYKKLPLKKEWFPDVVPPGTPVGIVNAALAAQLGLKEGILVIAGMTDGCASQIASGAVNLGDWNTTIGTTLVVKGVTKREIKDQEDSLYNHRHPEGYWMPGGASNIGADWVTKDFMGDLAVLNEQASQLIPTGKLAYPLRQHGERFPFVAPDAEGFEPAGLSITERFAANMEGVAYIERYAYEKIEKLSGEKVKAIYTAGGASNSDVWLSIRSNVMNLPVYKMKHITGAFGAAILAASKTHFTGIIQAAKALTQIEKEVHPQHELAAAYNKDYYRFLEALQEKGYIKKKSMLNIYLLRHGQTAWNADGNRYCGRTDIPLTEKGIKQAELVRDQLKDHLFDAVYASPLQRASITAQIVSGRKDVISDDRLIEADFGKWEGKPKEQFIQEDETLWNNWIADPAVTKAGSIGETAGEVVKRVDHFFKSLQVRFKTGNILVVAHNGVNRFYLAYKLGMHLKNYRKLVQENSTISMFQLDEEGELTLVHLNSKL